MCEAVRMHGRVSHIDKCCHSTLATATQSLNTHPRPRPPHISTSPHLRFSHTQATATLEMSSQSQTTSVLPSNLKPPPDPIVLFELNQARRAKVTREVEASRTGTCPSVPNVRNSISAKRSHKLIRHRLNRLQRSSSGQRWRVWKTLSRRGSSTAR